MVESNKMKEMPVNKLMVQMGILVLCQDLVQVKMRFSSS